MMFVVYTLIQASQKNKFDFMVTDYAPPTGIFNIIYSFTANINMVKSLKTHLLRASSITETLFRLSCFRMIVNTSSASFQFDSASIILSALANLTHSCRSAE